MEKIDIRQVIAEISSIDPVVAIDVSRLTESIDRAVFRARAAAAATNSPNAASAAPSKVALISIYGPLTPRGSWYGSSLSSIASQVQRAAADPDVAGIVLDVDSPGGTVAGTAEAAAAVGAAAQQKPCLACVNTLAASAAYWIASQASRLVMTPSSDVGSIGAMIMHADYGKMLEQAGINVTIIRSEQSPLKNEAHPFAPLSDDARAFLQSRANDAGADFIKSVAGGRKTTQTNVRENFGQGRMFGARDAVARGMADDVMTLGDAVASMVQKVAAARSRRRSALAFE